MQHVGLVLGLILPQAKPQNLLSLQRKPQPQQPHSPCACNMLRYGMHTPEWLSTTPLLKTSPPLVIAHAAACPLLPPTALYSWRGTSPSPLMAAVSATAAAAAVACHLLRMAPSCLAATASFSAPSTAAIAEPSSNLNTRRRADFSMQAQTSSIIVPVFGI